MTADYPGLVQALQSKLGLSTKTSDMYILFFLAEWPRQQYPDINQTT
jgi:hypothetical protein